MSIEFKKFVPKYGTTNVSYDGIRIGKQTTNVAIMLAKEWKEKMFMYVDIEIAPEEKALRIIKRDTPSFSGFQVEWGRIKTTKLGDSMPHGRYYVDRELSEGNSYILRHESTRKEN